MNKQANILIIDDEVRIRKVLADILNKKGYRTSSIENGEKAVEITNQEDFDAVLLDFVLPGMNGMEVLKEIKILNSHIPVIIITAYGSIPTAVEAIKQGAYDFIEKPLDADKILVILKNAIESYHLARENLQLRRSVSEQYKMVGKSVSINEVREQIAILAPKDCNVLITGESGTGKELVARSLHSQSNRVSEPFVKVNCAAIPNELIESELFGHKKGAFTGAFQDQVGKIAAANGGTLFLDEIGDLSGNVQAKLLQVLEEKRFYRLGEVKETEVDVRLIAATNKNLMEEIKQDRFREDLFYRLNTTQIHILPLRERLEDIPELINHYLPLLCDELNKTPPRFLSQAIQLFLDHSWPGNIRELKQKLYQMLIYHDEETIEPEYVQEWFEGDTINHTLEDTTLRTARQNFEREYIHKALIAHDWNMPATARYLRVDRPNLYRKVKQLGVER